MLSLYINHMPIFSFTRFNEGKIWLCSYFCQKRFIDLLYSSALKPNAIYCTEVLFKIGMGWTHDGYLLSWSFKLLWTHLWSQQIEALTVTISIIQTIPEYSARWLWNVHQEVWCILNELIFYDSVIENSHYVSKFPRGKVTAVQLKIYLWRTNVCTLSAL